MTGLLDPLAGRRFVVTGGTRGLGAAISRALVRRGARVDAWYRADHASADALVAELGLTRQSPGEIHLHAGNLVEPAEIRRVCAAILARDPRVDGFVHCAALGSFKPLLEVRPAQWELTLDVGARGFLLCVQQLAPAMPARAAASSRCRVSARSGSCRPTARSASPRRRSRRSCASLAVELAPRGIRVNAIAAGPVAGTSIARHPGAAELLERSAARTPAGRLVTADEVADLVLLLLSPLAQGLCGQVLVADGGLSLVL